MSDDEGLKVSERRTQVILALFSAAGLILTINLNLVSSTASQQILRKIRIPIMISTLLLSFSLLFGAFALSMAIRSENTPLQKRRAAFFAGSSILQTWLFFLGVVLIGVGVYLRLR